MPGNPSGKRRSTPGLIIGSTPLFTTLISGRTALFRQVSDQFSASPQIALDDVRVAAAQGFTHIINNRPEDESADQVAGADIEAEALRLGLGYTAIPVTHAGFSQTQVELMSAALQSASGPVLAYCRSGTRSTLLWALAQAKQGANLDAVAQAADAAGYDVSGVRPLMDFLAAQAR